MLPEADRKFIRTVRDGGGRFESIQVKMPKMTVWTPLRELAILVPVRLAIFSADFEEADFEEGGAAAAIVYSRLGVHASVIASVIACTVVTAIAVGRAPP